MNRSGLHSRGTPPPARGPDPSFAFDVRRGAGRVTPPAHRPLRTDNRPLTCAAHTCATLRSLAPLPAGASPTTLLVWRRLRLIFMRLVRCLRLRLLLLLLLPWIRCAACRSSSTLPSASSLGCTAGCRACLSLRLYRRTRLTRRWRNERGRGRRAMRIVLRRGGRCGSEVPWDRSLGFDSTVAACRTHLPCHPQRLAFGSLLVAQPRVHGLYNKPQGR